MSDHQISYTMKYKDSDQNSRTTAIRQVETYGETGVEHNYYWAINTGVTDQQQHPTTTITETKIVTFLMIADGDITVNVSDASTGSPDATWVLSSTRAMLWHEEMVGAAKPITQNIEQSPASPGGFYFTNSSGSTVNVNVIVLEST